MQFPCKIMYSHFEKKGGSRNATIFEPAKSICMCSFIIISFIKCIVKYFYINFYLFQLSNSFVSSRTISHCKIFLFLSSAMCLALFVLFHGVSEQSEDQQAMKSTVCSYEHFMFNAAKSASLFLLSVIVLLVFTALFQFIPLGCL